MSYNGIMDGANMGFYYSAYLKLVVVLTLDMSFSRRRGSMRGKRKLTCVSDRKPHFLRGGIWKG